MYFFGLGMMLICLGAIPAGIVGAVCIWIAVTM